MALTEQQLEEFYSGLVEGLLWSSTDRDYSEPPEGYTIEMPASKAEIDSGEGPVFYWSRANPLDEPEHPYDPITPDLYPTEREAIIAAWEDSGEEVPDLESLETFELAIRTEMRLRAYSDAWANANADLLRQYVGARTLKGSASPWEHAGNDLALTANGHGTGFWDRGLEELGDLLTQEAQRDYREPPPNYRISGKIEGVVELWEWSLPRSYGHLRQDGFYSQIAAIISAWSHHREDTGIEPPELMGDQFDAYIGDDSMVYIAGMET